MSYFKSLTISILILFAPSFCIAADVTHQVHTAEQLIKALQSGGHIIYMRHGQTNHEQKDFKRNDLNDCTYQRNLSSAGIDESKKIASVIVKLNIPIGEVYSSPYCRTRHTAKHTFGDFSIINDLQFSISKNKTDSEKLGQRLYQLMMDTDDLNKNTVFVAHTSNLKDGLGVWPTPEGVFAIFKKYKKGIIYKGLIKPSEWPNI